MDSDEKLIYLVQKYECLYDVTAKNYNDRDSKNKAWTKIAAEMNLSVYDCQKKWKMIRDCYRKATKLRTSSSGSARTNIKPVKFQKELEFLRPYMNNQPQSSNVDSSEETEENITDHTDSYSQSVNSQSSRNEPQVNMSQILYRDYIEAKTHEDPTDSFFLTMSRKLKRMPKKLQAELERDIFCLVNDAEIKLAEAMESQSPTEERAHTPSGNDISSDTYPTVKKELNLEYM